MEASGEADMVGVGVVVSEDGGPTGLAVCGSIGLGGQVFRM
jgi:hypothetical protein